MSLFADLGDGPGYLTLGGRLLRTPGIPSLLIWPLLITLVIYGGALAWALPPTLAWLEQSAAGMPAWFHEWFGFLVTLLQVILGALLVLGIGWLATLVATVLASPFYGRIAQLVEARLTGDVRSADRGLMAEAAASIARELHKLLWTAPRMIVILLLSLIPVIGQIASPLAFLFGAWVMAVQFADFTPENQGLSFAETRRRVARRRGLGLGFGALTALLVGIPFVNLFIAPAAVAGGTALWLRINQEWDGRANL
ncbi:MAG TPA: sulfate transporter CysZ [Pseudomonadales bacterium]|nr:sulfate transporter CysZ [Pseudomonadales bacterium]